MGNKQRVSGTRVRSVWGVGTSVWWRTSVKAEGICEGVGSAVGWCERWQVYAVNKQCVGGAVCGVEWCIAYVKLCEARTDTRFGEGERAESGAKPTSRAINLKIVSEQNGGKKAETSRKPTSRADNLKIVSEENGEKTRKTENLRDIKI